MSILPLLFSLLVSSYFLVLVESYCPPGKYFLFNRCVQCPSNCQECYYLFEKNFRRLICPACQPGSFLYDKRCEVCREGCEKCVGPSLDDCYKLSPGYGASIQKTNANADSSDADVQNGEMIPVFTPFHCDNASGCSLCSQSTCEYCLPKFVKDPETQKCLPCKVENCDYCVKSAIGEDVCAACSSSFFLDIDTNLCSKCGSNCATCNPDGFCMTCEESRELSSEKKCICRKGYYALEGGNCTKCNENCATCSPNFPCESCISGYRLTEGTCRKGTVENCNTYNDLNCKECLNGFYLRNNKCLPCNVSGNCFTCNYVSSTDTTECSKCYTGMVLEKGKCKFPDQNYALYSNYQNKTCIPGYFYDKVKQNCLKCDEASHEKASQCILCSVPNGEVINYSCSSCQHGFVLENGGCQLSCDSTQGFFNDPIIRDCVKQEFYDYTKTGIRPLMVYSQYSSELKMNGICQQNKLALTLHQNNHTRDSDCDSDDQCFCRGSLKKSKSGSFSSCICYFYYGRHCQLFNEEANGIKRFLAISMAEKPSESEKNYAVITHLHNSSYYVLLRTLFAINNLTYFLGDTEQTNYINNRTVKLLQDRLKDYSTIKNTIEDVASIADFLGDMWDEIIYGEVAEPEGVNLKLIETSYIFISNVISTSYPSGQTKLSAELPDFVFVNKMRFIFLNEDAELTISIPLGKEESKLTVDLQFNFNKLSVKADEVSLDIVSGLFQEHIVSAIGTQMAIDSTTIVNSPFTFKFMLFLDQKVTNYTLDTTSVTLEIPLTDYSYLNQYQCILFSVKNEIFKNDTCNFLGFNGTSVKGICSCKEKEIEEYVVLVTMQGNGKTSEKNYGDPMNIFTVLEGERLKGALVVSILIILALWSF